MECDSIDAQPVLDGRAAVCPKEIHHMSEHATISKNEAYKIADLVKFVREGRVRIPEFQRSFRWGEEDVIALFDSILRGYPFGSFLLWKRQAPKATLRIGAIKVVAPQQADALWVVDGQQRITSLVNAVDPEAGTSDKRFRVYYSLSRGRVVSEREATKDVVIPLPDLFDFGRALAWLGENPDASGYAQEIQRVTGVLNRVEVSAAVIEQADEQVLREVFDRINSAGKRLNAAEIFDAIHSANSTESGSPASLTSIANHLDSATDFGLTDTNVIVQALLVRRHPDITRDLHVEFSPNRKAEGAFPEETELDAFQRTETTLVSVIRFLQDYVGIPHYSFVPFRFQILVLARYFGLFPEPAKRNLELLSRWFWRSSIAAGELGLTGSSGDVRRYAGHVVLGDEGESVKRLIVDTNTDSRLIIPDLTTIRTNQSAAKVILAALWARGPVDPVKKVPISRTDLVNILNGESSPTKVALEVFPRASLKELGSHAANRVISIRDRQDFVGALSPKSDLESLLLDKDLLKLLEEGYRTEFVLRRAKLLETYLKEFLGDRTGLGAGADSADNALTNRREASPEPA